MQCCYGLNKQKSSTADLILPVNLAQGTFNLKNAACKSTSMIYYAKSLTNDLLLTETRLVASYIVVSIMDLKAVEKW